MISTARQMGVQVPVTLQQQYSLLSRESESEVVPAAAHNGIGLLPWSPLAGGFLAGKYQRGGTPAPDTRAGSHKPLYQWVSAEYARSDRNWDIIDTVAWVGQGDWRRAGPGSDRVGCRQAGGHRADRRGATRGTA